MSRYTVSAILLAALASAVGASSLTAQQSPYRADPGTPPPMIQAADTAALGSIFLRSIIGSGVGFALGALVSARCPDSGCDDSDPTPELGLLVSVVGSVAGSVVGATSAGGRTGRAIGGALLGFLAGGLTGVLVGSAAGPAPALVVFSVGQGSIPAIMAKPVVDAPASGAR
jgi:hypothetical protein